MLTSWTFFSVCIALACAAIAIGFGIAAWNRPPKKDINELSAAELDDKIGELYRRFCAGDLSLYQMHMFPRYITMLQRMRRDKFLEESRREPFHEPFPGESHFGG